MHVVYRSLLGTGEGDHGSNYRATQHVTGTGKEGPRNGGLSGYNTESLAVDHSGERARKMPRSLHDKNFFCRFRKRVGALQPLQKTKLRFYESSIPSCQ